MHISPPTGIDHLRRKLVQFLGGGVGVYMSGDLAFGAESTSDRSELKGTDFELEISPVSVNMTGQVRNATAVNGQVPAPTLRWREGDTITLRVTNRLEAPTSIHWHGVLVPAEMDGVPGLSFKGIAPGETFVYRFAVKQSGTYWYHSHSGFQEQTGLYGPIIIEPRGRERVRADREYVVMLSDWTDSRPESIFGKMKKMSDFFNFNKPTVGDFVRDVKEVGAEAAMEKRSMWNRMRMNPTDLGDLTAAPQSGAGVVYLLNGNPPARNWTALFRPGEKVRLRFINGAATTIFDVRIPGLKMTVISADGQDVNPVSVDEFRISVAETYDVMVEPSEDRAFTVFAQSIDRTGYARGTLAPRTGMQAEVPRLDKPQWLTMIDMMGDMAAGVAMGNMAGMAGMNATPAKDKEGMKGMSQSAMQPMADAGMQGMSGMAQGSMKSTQTKPMHSVRHAKTEYGPNVDMHVDMPRTNLDDPGINLRGNGRRVLTYADLRTVGGPLDARMPTRDIELHLTGHMERFVWSFDGQKFSESMPIHFRYGERLRIILVNDTMMNHPIHLHGMFGELESPDGQFLVRKHTINVQPAQRIAYRVTADALGRWAYHCHLLYHMEAGMFREVVVS
jgi:CopA family copper-resistance protein